LVVEEVAVEVERAEAVAEAVEAEPATSVETTLASMVAHHYLGKTSPLDLHHLTGSYQ
jgi:hypothetical protein